MKKFLVVFIVVVTFLLGVVGCSSNEIDKYSEANNAEQEEDLGLDNEFLNQFDLTDPKINSFDKNCDFTEDRVDIILKKNVSKLNIQLSDFNFENGDRLEFITPQDSEEYKTNPNFRHMLSIYLKKQGEEEPISAINQLKKLEFVRYVGPNYIYGIQDNNE